MKAVVYEKSNSSHVLGLREVEKPIPNDNEVLVKVHAVSLNAADYRSMRMGIIPKKKIFGADIAGRVEAVGGNIRALHVGDEVFGDLSSCGFGGLGEYVTAPESALALKPDSVSFTDAAAVPMAALTALQALRDKGNIQAKQKVLICGAGGGVGTFAVQLAKYFGAEVTAVCGWKNVELVRSLGADKVIDYTTDDFTNTALRYDLVLAVNGNYPLFAYRRLLARKGIYVMVGGALSQVVKSLLFGALLSIGGKKMRVLAAKASKKDLELIVKLVEEGRLHPVIDRLYPLDETCEAMRYLSQGHAHGKVVVAVV
jgi:NADPH:quinone reductase-like Zn-dependent oxidoreductase